VVCHGDKARPSSPNTIPFNKEDTVARCLAECLLQGVQFAGAHGNADRALGRLQQAGAGDRQYASKLPFQVVVQYGEVGAAHLVLGTVGIVDVIGRIGEGHVCPVISHPGGDSYRMGGIATDQAVFAQQTPLRFPNFGSVDSR